MAIFSATTQSTATVPADRMAIWAVLTDPDLLPKLTPLLASIDADGDRWTWHLVGLSALGVTVRPSFTELMVFEDGRRITYTHVPPPGVVERAGAEGNYDLADAAGGGTDLSIGLTLSVELPLPRTASRAVHRVMASMMDRTGDRFAANLLDHLAVNST